MPKLCWILAALLSMLTIGTAMQMDAKHWNGLTIPSRDSVPKSSFSYEAVAYDAVAYSVYPLAAEPVVADPVVETPSFSTPLYSTPLADETLIEEPSRSREDSGFWSIVAALCLGTLGLAAALWGRTFVRHIVACYVHARDAYANNCHELLEIQDGLTTADRCRLTVRALWTFLLALTGFLHIVDDTTDVLGI